MLTDKGIKNNLDGLYAMAKEWQGIADRSLASKKKCEQEINEFLFQESQKSQNEYIRMLGEARLHDLNKVKPTTPKLGYFLADNSFDHDGSTETDEYLYSELRKGFDISDYIFSTTHYDECSGGHYFRRS